MALYSLSVQMIKRSEGHSATAAAAYRAGALVVDDRTGERHDYRRKQGVISSAIIAPDGCPEWARDRQTLWNRVEAAETRINSQVARELRIALPHELTVEQQEMLVDAYCREVANRYGVPVDRSMHEPSRKGDQRNGHWHGLMPGRYLDAEGFGKKIRLLDDRKTGPAEVEWMRSTWADMANAALERAGVEARIDHRSYERQGLDIIPTLHMGTRLNDLERDGVSTRRGRRNARIKQRNALAAVKRDAVAASVGQTAAPAVQPDRGITHPEPTIPVPTPQPEPVRAPVEVAPAPAQTPAPAPVVGRERTPERPPTPAPRPGSTKKPQKQPIFDKILDKIGGFALDPFGFRRRREEARKQEEARAKRAAARKRAIIADWRKTLESDPSLIRAHATDRDLWQGQERLAFLVDMERAGLSKPSQDILPAIMAEVVRIYEAESKKRIDAGVRAAREKEEQQRQAEASRPRPARPVVQPGDDWPPQRPSGWERS